MTRYEQLSLRAHKHTLELLRAIAHRLNCHPNGAAHDCEIDLEHEIVYGARMALDEPTEAHG